MLASSPPDARVVRIPLGDPTPLVTVQGTLALDLGPHHATPHLDVPEPGAGRDGEDRTGAGPHRSADRSDRAVRLCCAQAD